MSWVTHTLFRGFTPFAVVLALLMSACAGGGVAEHALEPDYSAIGPIVASYFPAKQTDTVDNWGMVRYDGSMLFSNRFPSRPSAVVNGFFSVKNGAFYSVYRADSVPQAVDGSNNLLQVGAMAYGLMPIVRKGNRIELVDGDGVTRMQLTNIGDKEIVRAAPYFVDGLLNVMTQDGKWGAINVRGEMVLEAVYDAEPKFDEKVAAVSRTEVSQADSSGVATGAARTDFYLVNSNGKVIFRFPSGVRPIGRVSGGRIAVSYPSGRKGFIALDGTHSELPPRVASIEDYNADYLVWRDATGNCGLRDFKGRELIAPNLKSVTLLDSNLVITQSFEGVFAIADSVGTPRVKFNGFDSVGYLGSLPGGIVSPFRCVGNGFAGYVLMDMRGQRLGHGPFHAMSFSPTLLEDGYLHSDFFNSQTAVHEALAPLSRNGWGRAYIGMMMGSLLDSVGRRHTQASQLEFALLKPYMLDIKATAYSDRAIARDSVSLAGQHVVWADTTSRVSYIKVEVAAEGRRFPEMVQHVGAEIVPSGYRADKIRDGYAVYAGPELVIIFTPRPRLAGMNVFIMDRKFYGEAAERIIADAERVFEQSGSAESL